MLEFLLELYLLNQLPNFLFLPLEIAGAKLGVDALRNYAIEQTVKTQTVIYTADYTYYDPEWTWQEKEGILNLQDLIGFSSDDIKTNYLHRIRETDYDHKSTDDYTLNLYFIDDVCVGAEYFRPLDYDFCVRNGMGSNRKRHIYSEILGEDYPIDFIVSYCDPELNLFNIDPYMCIRATLCGDMFPYVMEKECKIKD